MFRLEPESNKDEKNDRGPRLYNHDMGTKRLNLLHDSLKSKDWSPSPADLHSPTILVIDDDAMNILVLQAMLKERDLTSDSAMSGPLALDLIRQRV